MILPSDPLPDSAAPPIDGETLGVRDALAAQRTKMANERTFLAYVRTALALILTGASAAHLPIFHPQLPISDAAYVAIGLAVTLCGFVVVGIGYGRYRRFQKDFQTADRAGLGAQS